MHSGGKSSKISTGDLAKAAQARRRQRVVQRVASSPNELLNRSMETGQDVADLLASVRKTTTVRNNNDRHETATAAMSVQPTSRTSNVNASVPCKENTVSLQSPDEPQPACDSVPKSALKQAKTGSNNTNNNNDGRHISFEPQQAHYLKTHDDASYLHHPMNVMVVSHHVPTRTLSCCGESCCATMGGLALGNHNETISIKVVMRNNNIAHHNLELLCYGDRVQLEYYYYNDESIIQCLSVQANENESETFGFDILFAPMSPASKAQQWVLFDTRTQRSIKVGQAGREEDTKWRTEKQQQQPPRPVRIGDPVVFRNCLTGGILSVDTTTTTLSDNNNNNKNGCSLKLVTDAYLQPDVADLEGEAEFIHADSEPTLLTRLRRSDRLVPSSADIFYIIPSSLPPMNAWVSRDHTPMYVDHSYLWHSHRHGDKSSTKYALVPKHTTEQERLIVDELIGTCMGLEGTFIKAASDNASGTSLRFQLIDSNSGRFDTILRTLVEDMLVLPTNFALVRRFVGEHLPGYEYGSVMQCFADSVGKLLEDHVKDVIEWNQQNQDGGIPLRQLVLQARSNQHSLSVLNRCCDAVRDKKGGALINALRDIKLHSFEGDQAAAQIVQTLLNSSSIPYMTRLSDWLEHGTLRDDPYQEFMVQRDESDSWENNYVLVPTNVLEGFFSTEHTVQKVLTTGRYWNVLQSSSNSNKTADLERRDSPASLLYTASTASVSAYVDERYKLASTGLVEMIMKDYDLMGSLRIMKHFFLLEYGDFFVDFLDKAEDEMLKDLELLSRNRIQNWMVSSLQLLDQRGDCDAIIPEFGVESQSKGRMPTGLCCRFSTEGLASHLDKLHAASGGIDPHEPWTPARHAYGSSAVSSKGSLTGLDTFFLEFTSIPHPISLILSPNSMECYQLLFRHLFFAKHVERRLVTIWKDHQALKELQALRGSMGPTFLLRQRMLHFVQNLIYYMMFEVVEPNWLAMEKAIGSPKSHDTQTLDDIIQNHNQFLHRALEACLLTNRDIVRALTKLMKTCLLFTEQMKRFMRATKIDEERRNVATEMQRTVQHNLNSRGSGRTRTSETSTKYIKESLQHARVERQKRVERQATRVNREVSGESYQRMVTRFEEVFSKNLRDFMVQLTSSDDLYHSHKVNLCIRLDYNGFVTSSLGLI